MRILRYLAYLYVFAKQNKNWTQIALYLSYILGVIWILSFVFLTKSGKVNICFRQIRQFSFIYLLNFRCIKRAVLFTLNRQKFQNMLARKTLKHTWNIYVIKNMLVVSFFLFWSTVWFLRFLYMRKSSHEQWYGQFWSGTPKKMGTVQTRKFFKIK